MHDAAPSAETTSILEGNEKAISRASQHLTEVGINNNVTLAEDCKPGS